MTQSQPCQMKSIIIDQDTGKRGIKNCMPKSDSFTYCLTEQGLRLPATYLEPNIPAWHPWVALSPTLYYSDDLLVDRLEDILIKSTNFNRYSLLHD